MSSFANPKDFYYQRYLDKHQHLLHNQPNSIKAYWYLQKIDHNDAHSKRFKQRYYIDESYSSNDNDPVFIYLCGESVCNKSALNGSIREYAKRYHAKLVALEHRYYGKSLPTKDFSTHNLRFLSTEQALDDIYDFQIQLINSKHWNGKWVVFGGSYPGSLSAYYRLKHPEQVVGALASSAPVFAKADFYDYDAHVAKVAGEDCLNKIQSAVREIEQHINNPVEFQKIKSMFQAEAIEDKIDFLYVVADIGATAVQYGMKDKFCQGLKASQDPLIAYAAFADYLYRQWGVDAMSFSAQGALSENPSDYSNGVGMRQWFYQSCTEYGYWQNANPNSTLSARSSMINASYHDNLCTRLFGINHPVSTNKINNNYYYPILNSATSNILFTNGSNDPWSLLSISAQNNNDHNPNLTYYTIDGAAHCDDLRAAKSSDSTSLKKARSLLNQRIVSWLGIDS